MMTCRGHVGQRLGTMGLSKTQPQPWRWCMQAPSHEMQVAGPEPLFTDTSPRVPLHIALLPPAIALQKRNKEQGYQRGAGGLEWMGVYASRGAAN